MSLHPIAWPESECCCKKPITGVSSRLGHVAVHTDDGNKTLFGAYSQSRITTVEQARLIEASYFYLQTGLEVFYLGQLVWQNPSSEYWTAHGRKTLASGPGVLYQGVLEYVPTVDNAVIQYQDNEVSGVLPRTNTAANNSYVKVGEGGQIIRTNVRYCYNAYGASSTRHETYELVDNANPSNSTFINGVTVGWTGDIRQSLQAANPTATIGTIAGEAMGAYVLYYIASGSGLTNQTTLVWYRGLLIAAGTVARIAAFTGTTNYVAATSASGVYDYLSGFLYNGTFVANIRTPGGFYSTVYAYGDRLTVRSVPRNSTFGTVSYLDTYYAGVLRETISTRDPVASNPVASGDYYQLVRFTDGTGVLWYKNIKLYDGPIYNGRNTIGNGVSKEVAVICTAYNSSLAEYSVRLFPFGTQVGSMQVYSAGVDSDGFIIVSNGTYSILNLAGTVIGAGYETAVKITDGSWLFYTAASGAGAWFLHGVKSYETNGTVEKLTGGVGSYLQNDVHQEPTYYSLSIRISNVNQYLLFYGATRLGQGRTLTGFLSNPQYCDKWIIARTGASSDYVLIFYENILVWEGPITGKPSGNIASYSMTRDYLFIPKNATTGIVLYQGQIVYDGPWISAVACFCAWDSVDSGPDVGFAIYDQLAVVDTETSFILGNGVFGLNRYSTAAWSPIPFNPWTISSSVSSFSVPTALSENVIDVEFSPKNFQVDSVLPDFPSWFQRMCNLAATLSDFAQDGFRLSDEAAWRRRFDLCRDCSLFVGNRCSRCGCYTSVKSRIDAARCPEGKW